MPTPEDDRNRIARLAEQSSQRGDSIESADNRRDETQVEAWLAEVDEFLCPHLQDDSSLEESTVALSKTRRVAADQLRNSSPPPNADLISVPGYAITAKIAEGGMGRVYAARDQTLDREVAIKTLLPGADAIRFFVESKITARLPHPGIPPVHALGTLADGTPYLAMKLIRGRTLAELLAARQSPADELPKFVQHFEQIAQAVGFAHAQGVIHRDLKPSNVMVGAFGEVQVMDWGLAKDLTKTERERPQEAVAPADPTQTVPGSIMGTAGYMSPEQARGEAVNAATDVFALGSILAVILTGLPAVVGSDTKDTIRKTGRNELDDALARLRSCDADRDLIDLAIHCLAPQAADRPPEARAVAEQVAAYRAAVEERVQQARIERKRRQVFQWAGGVVALVLLLGMAGTGLGLVRATAAAKKERAAREQTEKRLQQIEKGVELFAGMIQGINPRTEGRTDEPLYVQLRKRAEQAADELNAEAVGDPLAVARLQTLLGTTLQELGNARKAVQILEQAWATRQRELGENHPDTLETRSNLGLAYQGAGLFDKAVPLLEATFRAYEARQEPDDDEFLTSRHNLAVAYREAGQLDKALPLLQVTLQAYEAKLGPDDPETLAARNNLAVAYQSAGQTDQALSLHEKTHQLLEAKLGADHPDTLISRRNLAAACQMAGQLERGLALNEETAQAQEAKLGADHPETLLSRNNLAFAYQLAGRLAEALPLFESTLQTQEKILGPEHLDTLSTRSNLAMAYQAAGKLQLALPLHEETLRLREANLGPDHPDTLTSRSRLAVAYRATGQLDKALPLFEVTLQAREARLGPNHPDTLTSRNNLAVAYRDSGRLDEALRLYEATLQAWEETLGPDHPDTVPSRINLAQAYRDAKQFAKAQQMYERALAICETKLPPDHPDTLRIGNGLATVFRDAGQLDKALPLYKATLQAREQKLGPDHHDTINSRHNLAFAYQLAGQPDQALPLFEQAALHLEQRKFRHESAAGNIRITVAAYEHAGQFEKAETWRRKWLAHVRETAGESSPALAGELGALGSNLLKQQKWTDAEAVLRECLTLCEQQRPPTWSTFLAQSLLGAALLGQKDYTAAEPLLLQGYQGLKASQDQIPPPIRTSRLLEALDRLTQLAEAQDDADQASKWRQEREALRPQ